MTISCICEDLGAGKTLLLSIMAYSEYLKGRDVYSNYTFSFPYVRIASPDELREVKQGFFAGDDLYLWLSSRRIRENRGTDIILGKSRKRGFDIGWTSTRPMQLDINLRLITGMLWIPRIICDRNGLPAVLIAERFKFVPEARDEVDFKGPRDMKLVFGPHIVRKVMTLYDTEEEVPEVG